MFITFYFWPCQHLKYEIFRIFSIGDLKFLTLNGAENFVVIQAKIVLIEAPLCYFYRLKSRVFICANRKAMAEAVKQEEKSSSLPLHLSNSGGSAAVSPLPSLSSDSGSSPGVDKSAAERERQRLREQERRKREAVSIYFCLGFSGTVRASSFIIHNFKFSICFMNNI